MEHQGKTVAALAEDDKILGNFELRDEPRGDARCGLDALKRMGVSALILSGDNARTARAVAGELGIAAHGTFCRKTR